MKRRIRLCGLIVVTVAAALLVPATTSSALPSVPERIADGTLKPAYVKVNGGMKRMPFLSGGRTEPLRQGSDGVQARSGPPDGSKFPVASAGCANRMAGATSA